MSVDSWLLHSVQTIWFYTVNKLDVDGWNMGCFRGNLLREVWSSNEVSCRKSFTFVAFPTGPIKPLVNHWHTDCWLKLWKRSLSHLLLSHWRLPIAEKSWVCSLWPCLSYFQQRYMMQHFNFYFPSHRDSWPTGCRRCTAGRRGKGEEEKKGGRGALSLPLIHLAQITPRSFGSSLWYKLHRHNSITSTGHWPALYLEEQRKLFLLGLLLQPIKLYYQSTACIFHINFECVFSFRTQLSKLCNRQPYCTAKY